MARFLRLDVYARLLDEALVPLFHHGDAETACGILSAVADGGAGVCEFTNRGDHAIDVFKALARHCQRHVPTMILGAGSIVDDATAALFIAHGANFVVGPSFDERVARLCNRRRIAYIPGCQTATEIATAEEYGVEIVKFFPARAAGGPEFVKQLLGPAPGTRLLATGIGDGDLEGVHEAGLHPHQRQPHGAGGRQRKAHRPASQPVTDDHLGGHRHVGLQAQHGRQRHAVVGVALHLGRRDELQRVGREGRPGGGSGQGQPGQLVVQTDGSAHRLNPGFSLEGGSSEGGDGAQARQGAQHVHRHQRVLAPG